MNAPPPSPAERLGRKLGLAAFILILTSFIVVAGTQVMTQGFSTPEAGPAPTSCREGLQALIEALDRASLAPHDQDSERQRLTRFRESVTGPWSSLGKVERACSTDPSAAGALRALQRYRYALEESVRVSSTDLSPSRAAVQRLRQAIRSNSTDSITSQHGPVAPSPTSF